MDVLFHFLLFLATYFATVYLFLVLRLIVRKIRSVMNCRRHIHGADRKRQTFRSD